MGCGETFTCEKRVLKLWVIPPRLIRVKMAKNGPKSGFFQKKNNISCCMAAIRMGKQGGGRGGVIKKSGGVNTIQGGVKKFRGALRAP